MDFNDVLLTRDQVNLLIWIAARWEDLPKEKRYLVAAVSPASGDFIDAQGNRLSIEYSDLEELREKKLIRFAERGQAGAESRPVAERIAPTAEGLEFLAWRANASKRLSVRLTEEQIELLVLLVEETRRVSGGQQYEFYAGRVSGGDFVMTPTGNRDVFFPDIMELDKKDLITFRRTNSGGAFVVSPEGFAFHEEVKRSHGESVERVEAETRHVLDRHIIDVFGEAAQKWREAEDLLWRTDTEDQLTAMGHKCREALQFFAQTLYEQHCPQAESLPMENTVDKVRFVIDVHRSGLGKTTSDFLVAYWGTVCDLAVRAEHNSQREDRPLLWEDGRRLIFQTLLVMAEITAAVRG